MISFVLIVLLGQAAAECIVLGYASSLAPHCLTCLIPLVVSPR